MFIFMVKTRKIHCPHCGFLDTIKKVKEQAIHAIIVKIVRAISLIVESILLIKICSFGLSVGCAINKAYHKLQRQVDIVKGI